MSLTNFQRRICRLLADTRRASGESYVAGAAALNELLAGSRVSRDVDLFHDSDDAVGRSWEADRATLEQQGCRVVIARERPSYVEADVTAGDESVRLEWTRDSAFRFFPLIAHAEFGLVLHPIDLATNKLLALIGRNEVRDWVDVIHAADHLQPLGYLAWAASGKDPGFSPTAVIEHAARVHHAAEELSELAFDRPAPDAGDLSRRWRGQLTDAREIVRALPAESSGTCVLNLDGSVCRSSASNAARQVAAGRLVFHRGSLRGAFPQLRVR